MSLYSSCVFVFFNYYIRFLLSWFQCIGFYTQFVSTNSLIEGVLAKGIYLPLYSLALKTFFPSTPLSCSLRILSQSNVLYIIAAYTKRGNRFKYFSFHNLICFLQNVNFVEPLDKSCFQPLIIPKKYQQGGIPEPLLYMQNNIPYGP